MISAAELKRALGIDAADVSRDGDVEQVERAAVAFFEAESGHYAGPPAPVTLYLLGSGTSDLWLPQAPTGPINSITERARIGADAVVINSADSNGYVVRGKRIMRKFGTPWVKDFEYEVTYQRGYPSGQEPADIRQAVRALAISMWNAAHAGGKTSETIGGYSYSIDPASARKIPGLAETIGRYRVFRI